MAFAKELKKRGNISAHIYSFECNQNTLPTAVEATSPYPNITLTQKAVSQSDDYITFYPINSQLTQTTFNDGNQGASSTLRASGKYKPENYVQDEVRVPSTRLDSFMREYGINEIDILWMDIQGGELEALKSLGEKIASVKIIYSEVEFMEIYENQPLFEDILSFLEAHNFVFVGFAQTCTHFSEVLFSNALFVRKDCYKDINFNGFSKNASE